MSILFAKILMHNKHVAASLRLLFNQFFFLHFYTLGIITKKVTRSSNLRENTKRSWEFIPWESLELSSRCGPCRRVWLLIVRQRKRPDIVWTKARLHWHKFLLLNQHIYSLIWLSICLNSCTFDFYVCGGSYTIELVHHHLGARSCSTEPNGGHWCYLPLICSFMTYFTVM